ncbi:hypothetical protein CVT25_006718 [Psilocybe cyanescens]|uniref:Uncharacterized protein n=1 Tax=Psilocybe cyanescens TaxID=93625 RepID=A0A409XE55_PSICY|nr:hypothetical protein CVT25_006718 [Psilocybe cyanescens]
MPTRQPYSSTQRKLVLAFDVGTTFSGISYRLVGHLLLNLSSELWVLLCSILNLGEVAKIRSVTRSIHKALKRRFHAQHCAGGGSKIPTVIYYDKHGEVRAVGAKARQKGIEADAEDKEWTKAEWFKLHLHPQSSSAALIASHAIPPLPKGKTVIDVFADFLRYLHQCARTYIEETHPNGTDMWQNLETCTDFVLTHPNSWEGTQQSQMRCAAVRAGLIPNSLAGQQRLSFVTEGEVSLHFCIQEGLATHTMEVSFIRHRTMDPPPKVSGYSQQGKGIFIVDAGGGAVDVTAYRQTSQDTQSFKEAIAPQCHFQGSVFVTSNARNYLENLLENSRFIDDIPNMTEYFNKRTKLRFHNDDDAQYIKFGRRGDRDPLLNIRSGQLKLLGSNVASFFEPSIQCMVESIEKQRAKSETQIAVS